MGLKVDRRDGGSEKWVTFGQLDADADAESAQSE